VELKHYLRAIRRHWWVVVGVVLVTVPALLYLTPQQTSYETSGSYVVRPRSVLPGETVRATEALNRGVEINATYARIVRSDAVKERAQDELAARGISTEGLSIKSEVVVGTNILEIGAAGSDPDAVAAYAEAVGRSAVDYLDEAGEVYLLRQLDPPGDPDPVASNQSLTVVVGVVFGLLAGAVLAFVLEYLRESAVVESQPILDRLTGLYSDEYFVSRLGQELSRCGVPPELPSRAVPTRACERHGPVVTVGNLTLSSSDGSPLRPLSRRDAGQALLARLRQHDVLAYLGDDTFAVLLPDLSAAEADEILDSWQDHLVARDGVASSSVRVSTEICECSAEGLAGAEEIVRRAWAR
jgi:capsular polysaccharide biosynthesis protein